LATELQDPAVLYNLKFFYDSKEVQHSYYFSGQFTTFGSGFVLSNNIKLFSLKWSIYVLSTRYT